MSNGTHTHTHTLKLGRRPHKHLFFQHQASLPSLCLFELFYYLLLLAPMSRLRHRLLILVHHSAIIIVIITTGGASVAAPITCIIITLQLVSSAYGRLAARSVNLPHGHYSIGLCAPDCRSVCSSRVTCHQTQAGLRMRRPTQDWATLKGPICCA